MVLDDLLTLPGSTMIVAEGWGLRPELVLPLLRSPRQAIFLVPTDEFREHQIKMLPRAGALSAGLKLSDPERAQRNRLERDALIATDLMDSTQRLGLKVLEVDGSVSADGIARVVEEHFGEYLRRWLY
jgi:hypothetical protein